LYGFALKINSERKYVPKRNEKNNVNPSANKISYRRIISSPQLPIEKNHNVVAQNKPSKIIKEQLARASNHILFKNTATNLATIFSNSI